MKNHNIIKTDVVVVGGGAAGIAAAYAAAQNGFEVVLAEKNVFLGGMATAAYVGTICGLYLRNENDLFEFGVAGFARLFAEELMKRSHSQPMRGKNGLKFIPYDRMAFISLAEELMMKQNVRIMHNATVIDVVTSDGVIEQIEVVQEKKKCSIQARHFIDTSGLALFGNFIDDVELIESNAYQAGALVFGLSGLNVEQELHLNLHLIKTIKESFESGALIDDKSWVSAIPGSLKNKSAYFKLSIPFSLHGAINAQDTAEQYARLRIQEFCTCFKNNNPVFRDADVFMIAPSIGVRTGPRYQGDYILTKSDVLSCRKVDPSAAKGTWPIEYWEPGKQVAMTYFETDDYYDIPISCMSTEKVRNLYFAGRHISAEESAIASARVIGTCMQMGETVGSILKD